MNRERLTRLRDLLQQVADGEETTVVDAATFRFDMDVWIQRNDCGTAACAAGTAMLDPWFREQGLYPKGLANSPTFGSQEGVAALGIFFGLSLKDTRWLFVPVFYDQARDGNCTATPADVIKRIDQLLAEEDA